MPTQNATLEIGLLCRSRDPILKTLAGDDAHLCRVIAALPQARWRNPQAPEFKVELLAMPVTAFVRGDQLAPLP
jgi:hypothetical protein